MAPCLQGGTPAMAPYGRVSAQGDRGACGEPPSCHRRCLVLAGLRPLRLDAPTLIARLGGTVGMAFARGFAR